MPAVVPFIPLIISGIGAGAQAYQASQQGGLVANQKSLFGMQSGLAKSMADMGGQQFSMGQPAMQKAMDYYSTLATGNRGAINAALAPQYGQVSDYYSGAQKGIESKVAPGPGRDQALAELYRQKAGQLGLMPMQARSQAVGQLGALGENAVGRAGSFYTGASGALSGASASNQAAFGMQGAQQQQASDAWSGLGDAFTQYLKMKNTTGGSKTLPSKMFQPFPYGFTPQGNSGMARGFGG